MTTLLPNISMNYQDQQTERLKQRAAPGDDELADLETFERALVRQSREGLRDEDRSFAHLNAVEYSFVRILQRAISRQMARNVSQAEPDPKVTD